MATSRIDAVLRYCFAALVCLAIAGVLWELNTQRADVYSTRFDVVLLPPTDRVSPNSLARSTSDLSATAAVITTKFNGGPSTAAPASDEVSLVAEGVRDGHAVRVRNYGGQWSPDFSRPVIDVQVVGPSADSVVTKARAIAEQLADLLAKEQSEFGVPSRFRITMTVAADEPVVTYHGGARSRAAAATLLTVGAVGGTLFVAWARRRASARWSARQELVRDSRPPGYDKQVVT